MGLFDWFYWWETEVNSLRLHSTQRSFVLSNAKTEECSHKIQFCTSLFEISCHNMVVSCSIWIILKDIFLPKALKILTNKKKKTGNTHCSYGGNLLQNKIIHFKKISLDFWQPIECWKLINMHNKKKPETNTFWSKMYMRSYVHMMYMRHTQYSTVESNHQVWCHDFPQGTCSDSQPRTQW